MTSYTFTHLQFAVAFIFFEKIPFCMAQLPTPCPLLPLALLTFTTFTSPWNSA